MRTSEERARLIHRRTAEIKQEHRKKKQQGLYAVCMAACLFFGDRHRCNDAGIDEERSGRKHRPFFRNGKPDRKPCRTWLYHDGAVGIFPWSLRDSSFIPSASEM